MTDVADQPAPIHQPGAVSIWNLVLSDMIGGSHKVPVVGTFDLVVEDMRARDKVGRERYGTSLQTQNGRRMLVDAYQERLDYVVYLRGWIEESYDKRDTAGYKFVVEDYEDSLTSLQFLRRVIDQETRGGVK